ncbi:MAG: nucleotide sugar dehydrogenase, partial [Thaumarchaeota archaeon]|nr:nucleotide sugar dehydrogenase [Nitrososphaerota archaeon]
MNSLRVQVVGSGYVGLTTALALASRGAKVTAIEIDEEKRATIGSGKTTFYEPGVPELLKRLLHKGFEITDHFVDCEISFITVGTPSKDDGSIDLSYVESASKMLGTFLKDYNDYHTVVVKSTVVPGTTENVVKPAIENASRKKVGKDIGLCMNPEFLREGSALQDMLEPDRVVIGEYDTRSGDSLEKLYESLYNEGKPPLLRTNLVNA